MQLYTPGVGEHFLGMAVKLQDTPGLSVKNREIIILVVGTKYPADYDLYAQKVLALEYGVTQAEIDSILRIIRVPLHVSNRGEGRVRCNQRTSE